VPEPTLAQTEERMRKTIEALRRDLASIRTGRASPELLQRVSVDYYGAATPLQQVATLSTPDARTIVIQPWDRKLIQDIERAILKADLGFNPSNDGTVLRIVVPPLTQQRRAELGKMVAKRLEEGKVALRHERRDTHDALRKAERASEISADEAKRTDEQLQKMLDRYVAEVDRIGTTKHAEIAEV
jgi:ribosome recycling factor